MLCGLLHNLIEHGMQQAMIRRRPRNVSVGMADLLTQCSKGIVTWLDRDYSLA